MNLEKMKKLRTINIVTFILMILANIAFIFININGKSNITLIKEKAINFNYNNYLIIPYALVIFSLLLFVIFQSGLLSNRDIISNKSVDVVGCHFGN